MTTYIYLFKQKEHNRIKVGMTNNIKNRLSKLEKIWGNFNKDSIAYELDMSKMKDLNITTGKIERAIHTDLKLLNLYINDLEKADGSTEFFQYNSKVKQVTEDKLMFIIKNIIVDFQDILPISNIKQLDKLVKQKDILRDIFFNQIDNIKSKNDIKCIYDNILFEDNTIIKLSYYSYKTKKKSYKLYRLEDIVLTTFDGSGDIEFLFTDNKKVRFCLHLDDTIKENYEYSNKEFYVLQDKNFILEILKLSKIPFIMDTQYEDFLLDNPELNYIKNTNINYKIIENPKQRKPLLHLKKLKYHIEEHFNKSKIVQDKKEEYIRFSLNNSKDITKVFTIKYKNIILIEKINGWIYYIHLTDGTQLKFAFNSYLHDLHNSDEKIFFIEEQELKIFLSDISKNYVNFFANEPCEDFYDTFLIHYFDTYFTDKYLDFIFLLGDKDIYDNLIQQDIMNNIG